VSTTGKRERRINEKKSIYEKRNKIEKQQQTQTYAQALSPKSTSAPQAICYQRYVHSVNPYAWLSHLYAIWFTMIDHVTGTYQMGENTNKHNFRQRYKLA
tara:strand:- start:641 stop:940 length:300 start_codon:yes stop_codon:yes gene_type:complete